MWDVAFRDPGLTWMLSLTPWNRQHHPLSAQLLCVTTRHRRVRLEFVKPRVAFPERRVWGPALPQNSMHSLHRRAVVFGRLLVDGWGIGAKGLGLRLQGLGSRASGLVFGFV